MPLIGYFNFCEHTWLTVMKGPFCNATELYTFQNVLLSVKYAVEKNLLSDIALAMHSGISVEELLKDLSAEGK